MKILLIWVVRWLILLYASPKLWQLLVTDLCFNSLGAVMHRSGYMRTQVGPEAAAQNPTPHDKGSWSGEDQNRNNAKRKKKSSTNGRRQA